jgi:hypothetical protein
VLADWHGKGWLALVHFHLNSLAHFQRLIVRRAERGGARETNQGKDAA